MICQINYELNTTNSNSSRLNAQTIREEDIDSLPP